MVLGITSQNQVQGGFFGRAYGEREQRMMAVVDEINKRYGKGTLQVAAAGLRPRWRQRCEQRSPRYTTRWDELPVAIAV